MLRGFCVCVCVCVCVWKLKTESVHINLCSEELFPWTCSVVPASAESSSDTVWPFPSGLAQGEQRVCWEWAYLHGGRDHWSLMCKTQKTVYGFTPFQFPCTKALTKTLNQMYWESGLFSATSVSFNLAVLFLLVQLCLTLALITVSK